MNIISQEPGYVYLLHFEEHIAPGRHTCRHYIGYANDLAARLQQHERGHGARLTQVAHQRGIGFRVARLWHGDRALERRLKNGHRGPRLCPFCGRGERVAGTTEIPAGDIQQYVIPF